MKQYTIRVSAAFKKLFHELGREQIQKIINESAATCPACNLPWRATVKPNKRIGLWLDDLTAAKLDVLDNKSAWLRAVILKNTNRCIICERKLSV